ncbi:MAG: DUF975 family protein [Flavobacteriaceae bacterium]|nr:DUF975 family protein [Flavobacteriaceae bacterium]
MASTNLTHMRTAREKLKNNWSTAFLVGLSVMLPTFIAEIIPEIGIVDVGGLEDASLQLISVLLASPLSLGFTIYALNLFRNGSANYNNVFDGFNSLGKALGVYFLMCVVIILGMILLIVPGIILGLGLSMAYFVMIDKPELGVIDTLKESWRIMKGNKTKLLGLNLRFIPWAILGVLCLIIGVIFVLPWMQVSYASFYEKIK